MEQLNELALFAGAGGGILGGHLLGWRTVCAVEFAAYPRSVLLARQRDGMLPRFPIWDDVTTFDGNPWRGRVDVVSGGFPCQDISVAGKGEGLSGERSGLWSEMARIISEVQPRFAFVENSPMLTSRGLGVVLGDLSQMGYSAEWGVVGADDAGAPHRRERIWILAYATGEGTGPDNGGLRAWSCGISGGKRTSEGQHPIGQLADPDVLGCLHGQAEVGPAKGGVHAQREPEPSGEDVAHAKSIGHREGREAEYVPEENGGQNRQMLPKPTCSTWWQSEPDVGRVVDGVAALLDILRKNTYLCLSTMAR